MSENEVKKEQIPNIGKFYENKDKNDKIFLSGDIDKISVLLFSNKKEEKDDYDWNIFTIKGVEEGDKKELEESGYLYEKESKNQETFYTGNFSGKNIIVFKNKYKKEDKHPDWVVYLDKKNDKGGEK